MIRRLLLTIAFLLVAQASISLYAETRAAGRAGRSIPERLGTTADPGGRVILVLQAEDCRRSGTVVTAWNAVHAKKQVRVTGLVVGSGRISARERAAFARDGVRFPLRRIAASDAASIAMQLGFRSTPFVIVIDHAGRVAGAFHAAQNVSADALLRLMGPVSS
jgi:hypothetical protein